MTGERLQKNVVITNPQGLHMRPLTAFAQRAAGFSSDVKVSRDGRCVDGKSAWDMMLMLAPPGSELIVEVEGPDAPLALATLVALLEETDPSEEAAQLS